MKKTKRLGALANLAESREKEAILSLVEARSKKLIAERKLDQLQTFHDQYLANSRSSEQSGVGIARMLETRNFMDQIAKAIQDQQREIRSVDHQIRSRNDDWIQSRHHRSGLEKLIEKERLHLARAQDKREQSEVDDRSGRRQNGHSGTNTA